jgi:hypothetical protein
MDINVYDNVLPSDMIDTYHPQLASAFYDLKDRLWYRNHFKSDYDWDHQYVSELYLSLSAVMVVPPKERILGGISMMTRSLENRLPPRIDSNYEKQRSILFCVNSKWDVNWGGEILFYEQDEARQAVSLRPGRVISYDGRIPHCYTVPDTPPHITRYLTLMTF